MVAKLTKEPTLRKTKEGEEISKPPSPVSRSGIKQAMRVKCNTVIFSLQKKQVPCGMKFLQDLIFANFAGFPKIRESKIPRK